MGLFFLFSLIVGLSPAPLMAQGDAAAAKVPLEPGSPAPAQQLAYIPDPPPGPDAAAFTEQELRDLEAEDEEAYIYISSGLLHAPAPVNLGGNGTLTLTRYDNGEKITARYRRPDGSYDGVELKMLDKAMRCSLTGRETRISVKLIELLDAIEDKFGKKGLVLLSGYRSPTNNHRTPGAARESLHMLGWAADIRIPGYSSTRVKSFARRLRAGGVGYYPYKGFTHLDVGKTRYWVIRRPPRRRPAPGRFKNSAGRTAIKKRAAKPRSSPRRAGD